MNRTDFIVSLSKIFQDSNKISDFRYEKYMNQFRNSIFQFLIDRKNENDYFNLDPFTNLEKFEFMLHEVLTDIQKIGWKTKLSFNDTGLFIYTNEVPKTCW